MVDKSNKDSYIRVRIDSNIKNDFQQILKINGDTMSSFFSRTVAMYINEHKELFYNDYKSLWLAMSWPFLLPISILF